jgi:hypothetical protein
MANYTISVYLIGILVAVLVHISTLSVRKPSLDDVKISCTWPLLVVVWVVSIIKKDKEILTSVVNRLKSKAKS